MPVAIALIRGINVGGRNMLPMERLRALCEGTGLRDARTHIQSGNVIFRCADRALTTAEAKLESAIEKDRGFRPRVVVRTLEHLKGVASSRVFPDHDRLDPARFLVMFLASDPDAAARKAVAAIKAHPDRIELARSEVFLYFPKGIAESKLPSAIEKVLGAGTARNWNTVNKLLAMAEELEASS